MHTKGIKEILAHKFSFSSRRSLNSQFAYLLYSNDAPSEKESALIQDAIAKAECSKIQNTHKADRHSRNSDAHLNFLEAHRALLSASRRLPTELLIEIFLQFHFAEQHDDSSQNIPPWLLTHVCRRWRHIAINTPALWRDLPPFHLGSFDKHELKRRIDCLSMLLARSSSEKLSFFLSKKQTPCADDKILSMLFNHSERWERISLVISEDVCAHFSRIKGHISSLRFVKLFISRTGRLPVDMFEVAPNLRDVSLSSTPGTGLVRLPWHQLTSFTEESTESNHLHFIFREARDLRKLDFIFHRDSFDGLETAPHATFRQLTTLTVQHFAVDYGVNPLFDKLTLPALEELVLRGFSPISSVSSLALMVTRSACTLQKLVLHNSSYLLLSEIERILALTPSLTYLDIDGPVVGVLELLEQFEQTPVCQWKLVPRLRSLTICLDAEFLDLRALKHLTLVRCDLVFPSIGMAMHARPTKLETFRIIPPTRHNFLNYAEHFGLPTTKFDILKSASSYNMAVTNNAVDAYIQKIRSTNNDSQMARKYRSDMIAREIESTISLLEHIEITPKMVVYLYLKRINHIISQILLEVQISTNSKINFGRRFDALLPPWSLVLNQVSHQLRWGWEKEGGLIYIPGDGGSRGLVSFDFNVGPPASLVPGREEQDELF